MSGGGARTYGLAVPEKTMKTIRLPVLSALLLGSIAVSAAAPGVVSEGFLYEKASFPSCHASTLVETKDGLLAAYFGGTYERHPDVAIWTSRRVNGAWQPPVEVANGVESPTVRYPTWNPVLFRAKDGPLRLFYKVGPSPSEWWGMVMTSDDDGRTWSKPVRLPDGILGPIKNKPVQLANGDIVSGTSTEGDAGWRVHFERSTDGGATWTATPPLNDGQVFAAIQPSILLHADQRLQALGRTKTNGVFEIWSQDGGKTWGSMTATSLPNPNSGTDAVTLRDGRHLLVYNHSNTPKIRSPLNVALSKDGKHWEAAVVLEDDAKAPNGFSYPAVIQTSDGLVHLSYTWRRERIKHVVLDPAKLVLHPIENGVWPK